MSSKAQGLSLNTIIIAVLVLLVLFVLIGITTGYFARWGIKFNFASATKCSEVGGTPTMDKCSVPAQEAKGFFEDLKEKEKCCYKECSRLGGRCKTSCPSSDRLPGGDWSCEGLTVGPNCCK